jgi:hypothetical protein
VDDKTDNRHGLKLSGGTGLRGNHVIPPHDCPYSRQFINIVKDPKASEDGDDDFIDDGLAHVTLPVSLPQPALGTLDLIDNMVQQCIMSAAGRESLVSFIHEDV